MKKGMRIGLALIISGMAFFTLVGALNPEWKLVSRVSGTVQSLAAQDNTWNSILQARLLRDGDQARTLENSRAKIQLADQSVVTLGERTTVEIVKFQLKENKRIVEIKLGIGRLRANISKFFKGESSFEVKTTNTTLAARGTEFYVDVAPDEGRKDSSHGVPAYLASSENPDPRADAGGTGNMTVYLIVYGGAVNVTTPLGSRIFHAGESGFVTSRGVIIINPPAPPPPIMSAAGWRVDQDLRSSLRPQRPQGLGSIYSPLTPDGQHSGIPSGSGDSGTGQFIPAGSGSPNGTVPPPIFINPQASGGSQQGTINGVVSPGVGTIHITIK
jgi:hypothetical protein